MITPLNRSKEESTKLEMIAIEPDNALATALATNRTRLIKSVIFENMIALW
uniref:Uncharacterized protein n=1 Tax=Arion vulgaris TaxID=1028688 RepID=A0A0B6Z7G0_9EUPU